MSKEVRLTLPLDKEQARELIVGDIVYLTGTVCTMRDMGHRRAVDMLKRAERLPFDVEKGALWHCGPIVRPKGNNQWEIVSAGSTTSSRLTFLGAELIRMLKLRCVVGKGTMGRAAVEAMRETGSVFLNTTGGTAALYAQQIEETSAAFWLDLGMPEATWVMKVREFGPLIVGIDSHGGSLYQNISAAMKKRLFEQYASLRIDPGHEFSYMPKRVPGKAIVEP